MFPGLKWYLAVHLWLVSPRCWEKKSSPPWLRKWVLMPFLVCSFLQCRDPVFSGKCDEFLSMAPYPKKSSVIFNQQHISMEMPILSSSPWSIFLKSEVIRSTEQRNPRWRWYLISFLARSYSPDGLESWPLWHFCFTACYSNCLCECFFMRLLLIPWRLMPGHPPALCFITLRLCMVASCCIL